MSPFFTGVLAGLIIAAPLGPVGTFCTTRIIAGGRRQGVACAAGIALADGVYSAFALCGVTIVHSHLLAHERVFLTCAGIVLLVMGIKVISTSVHSRQRTGNSPVHGTFLQILVLSMVNPWAVITFGTLFAGAGITRMEGEALPLVTGVIAGSGGWWLLMTELLMRVRKNLRLEGLVWVNRVGGSLMVLFGIGAVVRLAF
ncbi:MAG: LysE family translocator [Desulfovibrionales bacterium]